MKSDIAIIMLGLVVVVYGVRAYLIDREFNATTRKFQITAPTPKPNTVIVLENNRLHEYYSKTPVDYGNNNVAFGYNALASKDKVAYGHGNVTLHHYTASDGSGIH